MSIIGPIIISLVLGFMSIICFYYTFKKYSGDDDEFLSIFGYDLAASIAFLFLLWLCKKLLPHSYSILAFRLMVLALGSIFLWGLVWFWRLL